MLYVNGLLLAGRHSPYLLLATREAFSFLACLQNGESFVKKRGVRGRR